MLPKAKRLNLSKNFSWVASGAKRETDSFKLFFRQGENPVALVGIALKGVFFKKSHERNKARRISSQAIEKLYPNLPNHLNLVIMPKAGVLNKKSEDLAKEIESVKDLFNSH